MINIEEKTKRLNELSEEMGNIYAEIFEDLGQKMEILEILKKWLIENIEDYSFSKHPHYHIKANYIYDNEPIFNVLKEWLGNDK